MTIYDAPVPPSTSPPPSRCRRWAAGALGFTGTVGVGGLIWAGMVPWGMAVIVPVTVAAVVAMATLVFSICALLGIDPGPAGDHLRGVVRDVLRRPPS